MDRGHIAGAIALVAGLAFQAWVTIRVFRSRLYEPKEKRAQAKLIWLLPVLGAIIAATVLRSEEQAEHRENHPELRS